MFRRLIKSVWLFPSLLFILLLLLTAFKISGSSIGIYYPVLYGTDQKNPNLLLNNPQSIRSDEWIFVTQMTIAQSAAGYPRVNHNIEYGRDMSVVGDAPYKDWSAIFKPQNFVFFVLPLAYAFAFKWWLLLFLVIVSCYFFILRFFQGRRLLAALLSSAVGLSPFLFWWYQTMTLAPIFYGFFIILISMRIIDNQKIRGLRRFRLRYSQLIYVVTLSYLLVAFALTLYPPFQIPIALSVTAFLAGYMLDKYGLSKRLFSGASLRQIGLFATSLLLAGALVLAFINTRIQAVHAIQHTIYPGSREILGGHTPVFEVFSTYLQPQLQHTVRAIHYYANQSEASNFVLLFPFLLLPGFVLIYLEYRQKRKLNWSLLLVQLLGALFLANLFISGFQIIYKLLLLDKVPHTRLFIGLGFVGILQLLLISKSLTSLRITNRLLNWAAGLYAVLCLLILAWSGIYVRHQWPLFIHNALYIGFLGIFFASIIFCFLSRRFMLAVSLFLVFSLGCVFKIHPLYRGLSPIYPSKLSQTIDSVSKPGDTWITVDNIYFENAAIVSNRNSLSGVQVYPDLAFWRQIEGPVGDFIYNRFAHVAFTTSPTPSSNIRLVQSDSFQVKFACYPFIEKHVDFVLSPHPIKNTCTHLVGSVSYPSLTFYMYRIDHQ